MWCLKVVEIDVEYVDDGDDQWSVAMWENIWHWLVSADTETQIFSSQWSLITDHDDYLDSWHSHHLTITMRNIYIGTQFIILPSEVRKGELLIRNIIGFKFS